MPDEWEPDSEQATEDGAVAPAKPAPPPDPGKAAITRDEAQSLFVKAQAAAKAEMVKEANLNRTQDEIDSVVHETLRSTSTEWYDRQPVDVREAARTVACNRMSVREDVGKLSQTEFRTELQKTAAAVAREMSGTMTEESGTPAELETRLETNRSAGETGVNNNAPMRKESAESDIDNPRWGANENYDWATSDQVEQELQRELRAANG